MEQEQVKVLMNKAHYFYKNKIPVHIQFKERYWKRGTITEIGADFFMLQEMLEGLMPIFFLELHDIKQFKTREEK